MSEKKNLGKVCLALQVWGYLLTCPSFLVLTLGRFSLGFLESSRSRNYLKPSFEAKFGDFQQSMPCTARNKCEVQKYRITIHVLAVQEKLLISIQCLTL